jgi:hypothetical protein
MKRKIYWLNFKKLKKNQFEWDGIPDNFMNDHKQSQKDKNELRTTYENQKTDILSLERALIN